MTERDRDLLEKYQELEKCYARLAELLAGEESGPQEIMEVVEESERIMAALSTGPPPEGEPGEFLARLVLLQKKAAGLTTMLQAEREKAAETLSEVKKGRRVLSAYVSSLQGTEYKEGKFVDRKK